MEFYLHSYSRVITKSPQMKLFKKYFSSSQCDGRIHYSFLRVWKLPEHLQNEFTENSLEQ